MLDYYTLQKTLETLSNDEHKYIAKDIATLCRQGKLTPYFSYNRYTAEKIPMTDRTGKDCEDFEPGTIRLFNDGYLTNHQLLDLLDGYSDSVVIGYAHDERGYECELFFNAINSDRYFNDENYSPYSDNDVLTVTKEHLSFKREQVQSYIASRQTNEQNTPEQQRIADLENQLAQVKAQLEEQTNMPADDDKDLSTRSKNLAAKIILALIDIAELDRDSLPYQYDNLRSNNRFIHDQIEANGMKVSPQKIGDWLDLAIKQTTDK